MAACYQTTVNFKFLDSRSNFASCGEFESPGYQHWWTKKYIDFILLYWTVIHLIVNINYSIDCSKIIIINYIIWNYIYKVLWYGIGTTPHKSILTILSIDQRLRVVGDLDLYIINPFSPEILIFILLLPLSFYISKDLNFFTYPDDFHHQYGTIPRSGNISGTGWTK